MASETEHLKLPLPHGGHVPVLDAIRKGFNLLDTAIADLEGGSEGDPAAEAFRLMATPILGYMPNQSGSSLTEGHTLIDAINLLSGQSIYHAQEYGNLQDTVEALTRDLDTANGTIADLQSRLSALEGAQSPG